MEEIARTLAEPVEEASGDIYKKVPFVGRREELRRTVRRSSGEVAACTDITGVLGAGSQGLSSGLMEGSDQTA